MRFEDQDSLVSDGDRELRMHMLQVLERALKAVDPYRCIIDNVAVRGSTLHAREVLIDLSEVRHIIVVGAGKASAGMARAVNDLLAPLISDGLVNAPEDGAVGNMKLHASTHPDPDAKGVEGARRILQLCRQATEEDLVICLISGGGSAMMPLPVEGISLEDKRTTARELMLAGATIEEINTVRRHLSRIKGGKLAKEAYPARVLSLILSDVVGDPLESIASGPTAPDPTSYSDALAVLMRYDVGGRIPSNVLDRMSMTCTENPGPGDPVFDRVSNVIVGSNRLALMAAAEEARRLGYATLILTSSLEGEAREVGRVMAAIGSEMVTSSDPLPPPAFVIVGGETTVTVRGSGEGGRNTELVLGALARMKESCTLLSFGSDGIDGTSGAGGAIADGRLKGEVQRYLDNNDSASYFRRYGGLIVTGPTGTNVGDIVLLAASGKG